MEVTTPFSLAGTRDRQVKKGELDLLAIVKQIQQNRTRVALVTIADKYGITVDSVKYMSMI